MILKCWYDVDRVMVYDRTTKLDVWYCMDPLKLVIELSLNCFDDAFSFYYE